MLAAIHWVNGRRRTYERGGVAKCAKGIQNAHFPNGPKLTYPPAREETYAEQKTRLHYTHYCEH